MPTFKETELSREHTKEFICTIDALNDGERLELREFYLAQGIDELPRNLYYNYKTQTWI